MYPKIFKPLIDFVVAFAALLVLGPLLIFVAIALAFANNGSPFFFQLRPGKNNKIFKIIKFKTMTDTRDMHGNLLPDEDRLTSIGKFVRKTSIDEIPQLINVLLGEMSLVGPRPLLVEYLPLYNKLQNKRHQVKPGITGWAQVNGRNSVSWDDKFRLDVYYVENINILLDLRIILKTIKKVIMSEGISAEGHATMPTFIEYLKQKENS